MNPRCIRPETLQQSTLNRALGRRIRRISPHAKVSRLRPYQHKTQIPERYRRRRLDVTPYALEPQLRRQERAADIRLQHLKP